jgi:hypothetical protein
MTRLIEENESGENTRARRQAWMLVVTGITVVCIIVGAIVVRSFGTDEQRLQQTLRERDQSRVEKERAEQRAKEAIEQLGPGDFPRPKSGNGTPR